MPGKEKVVKQLKDAAKDAEAIYVATDPDREGEAIGRHIADVVGGRGRTRKSVYRVLFNEITKSAIQEAFKTPGVINDNLVDAQQARRVLDRPSATRSVLCSGTRSGAACRRDGVRRLQFAWSLSEARSAFLKTEYWTVKADFSAQLPPAFDARLHRIGDLTVKTSGFDNGTRKNEFHISDEATAQRFCTRLEGATFTVSEVVTKEKKRIRCRPSPRSSSRMPHVSCDLLPSAPCSSLRSSTKESSWVMTARLD